MTAIFGPPGWNSRENAASSLEELDLERAITRGRELWAKIGEEPHADAFWNVVAPLVHALASENPIEVGYGKGFSAVTACEQLMHEVALGHQKGQRS